MLSLRGAGAKHAFKTVFANGSVISFTAGGTEDPISVRVVDVYKHMGVKVHKSACVEQELVARCGQTLSTCANLRCKVFKSKILSVDVKISLVQSLLHSRLFYNAQLWPLLNTKQKRKLQHAYVATYRAALSLFNRHDNAERSTDIQVLESASAPDAAVIVRVSRLKYFSRLIRSDQKQLLRQICATAARGKSWLAAVVNDCQWLKSSLAHKLEDLPNPATEFTPWLQLLANNNCRSLFNAALEASLVRANVSQVGAVVHDSSATFFCYECGRSFTSMQLLNNHAHRSHGYISPSRLFALDLQCKACLTVFGSRHRVVQHLADRRHCLHLIMSVYQPLPADTVRRLDSEALAMQKTRSVLAPAMRTHGPAIHAQLAATGKRVLQ